MSNVRCLFRAIHLFRLQYVHRKTLTIFFFVRAITLLRWDGKIWLYYSWLDTFVIILTFGELQYQLHSYPDRARVYNSTPESSSDDPHRGGWSFWRQAYVVDGAIDGVVCIYLLALRLPFTFLPFKYLFVPWCIYLLRWSLPSLCLWHLFFTIFLTSYIVLGVSFISIVICSHSFLVPSLVGLDSLNIEILSMVTDYSVRLAMRRLHHWRF